jgi:hypothetical protein
MFVYVAGPISGREQKALWEAIREAEILFRAGHTPIVPHLFLVWDKVYPHSRKEWLELDLRLLRTCEAMVRLPGESEGAAGEELEAVRLGIPIYASAMDFLRGGTQAKVVANVKIDAVVRDRYGNIKDSMSTVKSVPLN